MFTEQEIEKLMAEVILRTVKESKFSTNIKDFCASVPTTRSTEGS